MKYKILAGLITSLATSCAFAQSSVEIYGIFDIGVGHAEHSLNESSTFTSGLNPIAVKTGNNATTGMFTGGLAASRIGFKGTEDMGNGLKTIFVLETGFNSPDGVISNGPASLASNSSKAPTSFSGDSSTAGQLFNRAAYVGLSSSQWGTLTFGRVYSLGSDVLTAYDPMEGSTVFSPLGYSGQYAGGGLTEDLRIDNSIKYKYQNNGINFGALYKFGGQAGSTDAQSEFQFDGGYDNGNFGIEAAYSSVKDGISAASSATVGTLNLTVADTTAYMLAAGYKMDQWRLRGGYEHIEFNNPSNAAMDASISNIFGYPVGTVSTTAYKYEKDYNIYFAGLTYYATPTSSITVAAYDVKQNDYSGGACTTGSNVASCSGSSRYYSILADYKFSKRTDVYAGYMYNKVEGGFSADFLHDGTGLFGFGMKHAF